jgi:hypothetical protein
MAADPKQQPWLTSIAGQGGFCFNDGKEMTELSRRDLGAA